MKTLILIISLVSAWAAETNILRQHLNADLEANGLKVETPRLIQKGDAILVPPIIEYDVDPGFRLPLPKPVQPPIVEAELTDTNKSSRKFTILTNEFDGTVPAISSIRDNPLNVTWYLPDDHGELRFLLSTNAVTNWVIIEKFMKGVPLALGATQFDATRQVGTIQSNLVLTVSHEKRTNQLMIKTIGREEYPSQKRILKGGGGK